MPFVMPPTKRPRPTKFSYWSDDVVSECKEKLLAHQYEALTSLRKWFCQREEKRHALVSMPTGSGKTGVICCLPYFLAQKKPEEDGKEVSFEKPILVIAPHLTISSQLEQQILVSADGPEKNFLLRREIVAIQDQRDALPSGVKIEKTTEVSNQQYLRNKEVVIANAQKFLSDSWEENLSNDLFEMVIVDEAHHFPAETWSKIIRKFEAHALVVFFTATPFRSDGRKVVETSFAYHLSLSQAIENGIIRPTKWDDYELNQDPDDPNSDYDPVRTILKEIKRVQDEKNREQRLPGNVPHMAIAICKDTGAATEAVNMWNTMFGDGTAVGVHCRMQKHRLKKAMERIDKNDVKLVVVVDMLQEGFDHPPISIAAIMTRIVSPVKFVQFIGRAQRVVRVGGEQESRDIHANIISHTRFQQEDNYSKFENEALIYVSEEGDE